MDPADQSSEDRVSFWPQVMPQVAAGIILLAVAGIGYIGITVPRQLDLVLENQKAVLARQGVTEGRLEKVEGDIIMVDRRVTRLEAHQ